ncbi:MAG TPA: hydrogenase maturation protease [Gammaproteobacteria bacterium]|nr:hydrogenase maturation protease [Chromatiaceae bacterium]HPE79039.1 hydrogenase maturation protease [Gammaproteobacteria bacterium]
MIRIIGLGSPFGDDQVGWRVIELLQDRLDPQVDLVALDRPGAALINWMAGVRRLVIVDALVSGHAPGHTARLTDSDLDALAGGTSSHQLDLAQTLALAGALDCLPEQVEIYGIEIDALQRTGLSGAVADSAVTLAKTLAKTLTDLPVTRVETPNSCSRS